MVTFFSHPEGKEWDRVCSQSHFWGLYHIPANCASRHPQSRQLVCGTAVVLLISMEVKLQINHHSGLNTVAIQAQKISKSIKTLFSYTLEVSFLQSSSMTSKLVVVAWCPPVICQRGKTADCLRAFFFLFNKVGFFLRPWNSPEE